MGKIATLVYSPMAVNNVNFTLMDDTDLEERESVLAQQYERGFDDSEVINLDSTICAFITPRLKVFMERSGGGYPGSLSSAEEWNGILKKIYFWASHYGNLDPVAYADDENKKLFGVPADEWGITESQYEEMLKDGFELFCKHFCNLWL